MKFEVGQIYIVPNDGRRGWPPTKTLHYVFGVEDGHAAIAWLDPENQEFGITSTKPGHYCAVNETSVVVDDIDLALEGYTRESAIKTFTEGLALFHEKVKQQQLSNITPPYSRRLTAISLNPKRYSPGRQSVRRIVETK